MPDNVKHIVGDLFSTKMPAIGQGVNIDGVMGAGIAKIFRERYPEMYRAYRTVCSNKLLDAGDLFAFNDANANVWILNLASQDRPGANARLDWLASSLLDAFEFVQERGLTGFALPRIGAGIGGLTHADVVETINAAAAAYPHIEVEVYALAPDEFTR